MTEPLTLRKQRLLQILKEEQENQANDLTSADCNKRAFKTDTRVAVCRHELGDLRWRGFVEPAGIPNDSWRITPKGLEAIA